MSTPSVRVAVIGAGGSISTPARGPLDLSEYADYTRTLDIADLLAMFRDQLADFDLLPVPFRTFVSYAITTADWLGLNDTITAVLERDPSIGAIVVVHGTSTLEETAYFLSLVVKTSKPVVVMGAQRPPNGLGTDAGIALVNAFRVATSNQARDLGVMVVMGGEILSARDVTKESNTLMHSFRTHDLGALGYVDPDGTVTVYRRSTRRTAPDTEFDVNGRTDLPLVDIVYGYAGADGRAIDALVRTGSRGIVVAGMPPGVPTPAQFSALAEASRQGVLVVRSSRGRSGRVMTRSKYREAGFVAADTLNPQRARILAMLALTVTEDRAEITRMFAEY
jgi:L-asparaginase